MALDPNAEAMEALLAALAGNPRMDRAARALVAADIRGVSQLLGLNDEEIVRVLPVTEFTPGTRGSLSRAVRCARALRRPPFYCAKHFLDTCEESRPGTQHRCPHMPRSLPPTKLVTAALTRLRENKRSRRRNEIMRKSVGEIG